MTPGQMAQSKKKTLGHSLLYYTGTDGSVQKENPVTDIYCFTVETLYSFIFSSVCTKSTSLPSDEILVGISFKLLFSMLGV